MISRRTIVTLSAGASVAMSSYAAAQTPAKPARIGVLSLSSPEASAVMIAALEDGLRKLGYAIGRNVTIEYRWGRGQPHLLVDLVADLVRLNVDVIVTVGNPSAQAAAQATKIIPIVCTTVALPVELGLAASLARPGGNLTGVAFEASPQTALKALGFVHEAVPSAARFVTLRHNNPSGEFYWAELQASSRAAGMELRSVELGSSDDIEGAFTAILRQRPDALLVLANPLTLLLRARIANFALKSRLPSIGQLREYTEAGGFMSYGPSLAALYGRGPVYIDKILKGAKPADLPIEQPTILELVINLKTAKALGIEVPPALLARADEVIE